MPPLAWILAAVLLAIAELLTGTLFLLAVAAGCLVAAICALAFPVTGQIVGLSVGTGLAFVLARPLLTRFGYLTDRTIRTNVEALTGQTGNVVQEIGIGRSYGRVLVGGDDWRARNDSEETIESGARVIVVGVEGATLLVVRDPDLRR
jgi:membrane protein implicated in regulation of membrane protease activity